MQGFIRSILTQKSKPAVDYVIVVLHFYVLALLVFVVGMVVATSGR